MKRFLSFLALLTLAHAASAQQAWDTNVLTWVNPTTCSTGEPIAQCPISAIRIEEGPTTTGPWRLLTTLSVVGTTYSHGGVSAGQHCYRVSVDSPKGPSVPSNTVCKTNTKPVGPPNPPTNLVVVDPIAYNVRPDYGRFVFVRGSKAGFVRLGTACDATRVTADGYTVVVRPHTSAVIVAKCASPAGSA